MHLLHLTKDDTVEPLNKVHFGTVLYVLCKEGVHFGRSKMYQNNREDVFWDFKLRPL